VAISSNFRVSEQEINFEDRYNAAVENPARVLHGKGVSSTLGEKIKYLQEQLQALIQEHEAEDYDSPVILASTPKERVNTRRKEASELYKEAIGIERESSDEQEEGRVQQVEKRAARTRVKQARKQLEKRIRD
jgi:hypothetical protein